MEIIAEITASLGRQSGYTLADNPESLTSQAANIFPDDLHNKLSNFYHPACTFDITLEGLANINIRSLL